ncbi:site-specific tyrosine recombinase/integron integrase [Veillonella tobetsuensis]|uniref:site-specific tyrosine recombinase/integron integrase n=1 Tax=Veillonella tobetsuensis TaxID=1110546 RepID=UPI001BB19E76|nr:site-specific tyrosine recombinase/integron integrase [Veillonella tobetsuensis]
MSEVLSAKELYTLQIVLQKNLNTQNNQTYPYTNIEYMDMFISAKRIEGCSERTLAYYKATIEHMLSIIVTPLRQVNTDDLRAYLAEYQLINNCSKTTVDNIRRNLSSFFSWLEAEDYIIKSPIRRIHKIRTGSKVKETLSEECIERLRDSCLHIRDLAMIDFLYSTGIRVGELVNLNIGDINFEERECIVYGKGNKQRKVYFDAKAKVHLKRYLEQRNDYNEALFVTLDSPFERLKISGVEIRLRKLGRLASLDQRVHPHKFRRSMATRAIDKGMPIEQVQKLLGHQQIDTTMHYAMVNQSNVKISHRKFIG